MFANLVCLVVAAQLLAPLSAIGEKAAVLHAGDFGVRADGVADDGPAIARMLQAAATAGTPVCLKFPENRIIRVERGVERYAFRLHKASRVTLDGSGCTFLLGPTARFLRLSESSEIAIRNLRIDFDPLPFADGTVAAVDRHAGFVDVRLSSPTASPPLGKPTRADGEQAFFGMLWHAGPYGTGSRHYWIARTEAATPPNVVRVFADEQFKQFGDIEPEAWRISLPVPGIAHRFGPGACLDICDNNNVTFEDVELWSAPWFGFHVMRNRGKVTFRRVHIRPKPKSGRLMSTWRDGFHVKGNSASLLWEDCILSGMNDDALNLSTHCSRVTKVLSPTEFTVQQSFPLNPMPWHVGAALAAADYDARIGLGNARIVRVRPSEESRTVAGQPAAMSVLLQIDRPIDGLKLGTMVWQPEHSNPDTTLRRCKIEMSCRLQTPVTLESCDVTALLWFYGERIEGPFPSRIALRDCRLRRGRGNPRLAVSIEGRKSGQSGSSTIQAATIEGNQIWGDFSMVGVDRAQFRNNQFRESGAKVRIEDCPGLAAEENRE